MNVARTSLDIYSEAGHDKIAGYTKEEREWIERFLKKGFVDAFREKNPEAHGFTYFNNMHNSRLLNNGWRIDYFLISERLFNENCVQDCSVFEKSDISDHNPIIIHLKKSLLLSQDKDLPIKQTGVRAISTTIDLHSFFNKN